MFLTTNRVGVLDEAIKSRLTYTAYYPPLDKQQTRDIWRVHLRLLKERNKNLYVDDKAILQFARAHFEENQKSNSTWNGRQIQNAFKVASALADWDETMSGHNADGTQSFFGPASQPCLQPSHFQIIADGTRAFDLYLQEAVGASDGDRAYSEMARAPDDFVYERKSYDYGNHSDYAGIHSRSGHPSRSRQQSTVSGYQPVQKPGLIQVPQVNPRYGMNRPRLQSQSGMSSNPVQINNGGSKPRRPSNQQEPAYQPQHGLGISPRLASYAMHPRTGSGAGPYHGIPSPSADSGEDLDPLANEQYVEVGGMDPGEVDEDGDEAW